MSRPWLASAHAECRSYSPTFCFIGNVPTPGQPNALTVEWVSARLRPMTIDRRHEWDHPFARGTRRAVLVARAPAGDQAG